MVNTSTTFYDHQTIQGAKQMLGLIPPKLRQLFLNKYFHQFIDENASFIPRILPETSESIALSQVTAWQNWQDIDFISSGVSYGVTKGWVFDRQGSQHHTLRLDAFEFFVKKDVIDNWECEIQDVEGLAASKSMLENFSSLDEMVEKNSKDLIFPINEEQLQKNLQWFETRIFHDNPSDYFETYSWDPRIYLINSGGSHHFAAARYLAKRLNRKIFLKSKLCRYTINAEAVDSLVHDFEMFVVSKFYDFTNNLISKMQTFEVDFFMRYLPMPYREDYYLLLLPRNNPRSIRVAKLFKSSGAIDLGLLLTQLNKPRHDQRPLPVHVRSLSA